MPLSPSPRIVLRGKATVDPGGRARLTIHAPTDLEVHAVQAMTGGDLTEVRVGDLIARPARYARLNAGPTRAGAGQAIVVELRGHPGDVAEAVVHAVMVPPPVSPDFDDLDLGDPLDHLDEVAGLGRRIRERVDLGKYAREVRDLVDGGVDIDEAIRIVSRVVDTALPFDEMIRGPLGTLLERIDRPVIATSLRVIARLIQGKRPGKAAA